MRKPSAISSWLGRASSRTPSPHEGGQGQEAVAPGRAGFGADRPARFRRDEGQAFAGAGRRASVEVQPEAALGQDLRLESRNERRRERFVVELFGDQGQRVVHRLMRIALGQEPRQRAEPGEAGERERAFHQPPRPQAQGLDGEGAEMLVEPRPPDEAERIARLQRRIKPRRSSAAHKTR